MLIMKNAKALSGSKYLILLAMLYVIALCAVAILAFYVAHAGPLLFTEGSAMVPLMYFCEDIITEVYGYQITRRVIWSALISVISFMCLIMLMVHLPVPSFFLKQQHLYQALYDKFPRVIICMLVFIPVSEFINAYILSKLKVLWQGR